MSESKAGQMAGTAVGAILLFALLGSVVSCGVSAVSDARHPERRAERRSEEAAKSESNRRQEEARKAEDAARRAEHALVMDRYAQEARANENRCLREMDYETCRRIYHPTAAERAAEQASVDRAARIAEAYRE